MSAELRYVIGDATRPRIGGPLVVAHVVNDVGAWGRGFVTALSARWAVPEATYRRWYRDGVAPSSQTPFALGQTVVVPVASDTTDRWWVAHLLAQRGLRSGTNRVPLDVVALGRCLGSLATAAAAREATVVMPRIGAGLAGGDWATIERLLVTQVVAAGVTVVVHDLPS